MVTRTEELPEEADTRQPPLAGLELRHVVNIDDYDSEHTEVETSDLDEATVITSIVADATIFNLHKVVVDLDHPAILLDSSTPGHHHLYIDKEMPWDDYAKLLRVMAEVGLLEQGYVDACLYRGYSAVRLPWVRKGPHADEERRMRCAGCGLHPVKIRAYDTFAEAEGCESNAEFVRKNEGTYNKANGHFWCDACYIAAGMPLGVAP